MNFDLLSFLINKPLYVLVNITFKISQLSMSSTKYIGFTPSKGLDSRILYVLLPSTIKCGILAPIFLEQK